MASIAMEECEEPYPVSMIPLVLRRFEWSEFEIPPEHPCRAAFHRLKTQNRAVDYEQQKSLLERMHEKAGEDVFVSSYLVFEKDAVIRSLCTWSDAGIQLLPETEFVVFMRLDGQGGAHRVGEAAWTNVREVLSAKMELSDLYPPRWKVDGVPDDAELALLDLR